MLKTQPVWALGTMSGTSLDGVDAALLQTDGEAIFGFGDSGYRPYSEAERAVISAGFGKWPGDAGVLQAESVVEAAHIELLSTMNGAEVIGFHGQTLAHDPRGRGTHQVGDGLVLATALGLPVVWDFRSEDVRQGGQGAPLAPLFHFACAKWIKATDPVVFLNLGGVGNLTWVDASKDLPQDQGALLACDTGPANAPINDLMMARLGQECDWNGRLAAAGVVDTALVDAFLKRAYFQKLAPKSLDRNDFTDILELVKDHSDADAVATLCAIAAASVAKGMLQCPAPPTQVLVTGGGRKNPVLMAMLADLLDCPVQPVEDVGLDGDMLEAQAFAYLAVRRLQGLPTSAPMTTGVVKPVGGGQISQPE